MGSPLESTAGLSNIPPVVFYQVYNRPMAIFPSKLRQELPQRNQSDQMAPDDQGLRLHVAMLRYAGCIIAKFADNIPGNTAANIPTEEERCAHNRAATAPPRFPMVPA